MVLIILISGKRCCGKDTSAEIIFEFLKKLGIQSKITSFAYEVKRLFAKRRRTDI